MEIPESVLPKQQVTEQPTEEGTPQGKQAAQPDTGDKPVEPKTQNETEPVESGGDTTAKLLHFPVNTNPHRSLVTQREFKGVETIGASEDLSG